MYPLNAMKCGRNSVGIEIDEEYCRMALNRLKVEGRDLFREPKIELSKAGDNWGNIVISEEPAGYRVRKNRKTPKRKA